MARIIFAVVLVSFLLPGFVLSQDYPKEVTRTLYEAYNPTKSSGDINRLQQALDAGLPVNAVVFDRQTLLMMACHDSHPRQNQADIVELLLNKGANPNAQVKRPDIQVNIPSGIKFANEGQTALIMAVKNVGFSTDRSGKQKQQQLEIVELLLKAGADVNIRDEKGLTAVQYALQSQHAKHLVNVLMTAQQRSKR